MLRVFGFKRVAVALSDIYFVDPDPSPGQEGPEHGVRLEVRLLEALPLSGSIYAARPIKLGRPVWRADLLESVNGEPGSFDRTHHHPRMDGWEPGPRTFDPAMTEDPIGWLGERLGDLGALMGMADVPQADPDDVEAMRRAVPEIQAAVERQLEGVRSGTLAPRPESVDDPSGARVSWL